MNSVVAGLAILLVVFVAGVTLANLLAIALLSLFDRLMK